MADHLHRSGTRNLVSTTGRVLYNIKYYHYFNSGTKGVCEGGADFEHYSRPKKLSR